MWPFIYMYETLNMYGGETFEGKKKTRVDHEYSH